MAKRVRVSRSTHRPGGQGPNRASKPADADPRPGSEMDDVLSAEDIGADYDEVEVDEVAAAAIAAATASPPAEELPEPPPTAATARGGRRATSRRTSKRRTAEELTARAAAEDAWVREDLRRIGLISVLLLVLLAVAWVLFGVVDVLGLY